MSFMLCPNCGKQINYRAGRCKYCGWQRAETAPVPRAASTGPRISLPVFVGAILLVCVLFGLFSSGRGSSTNIAPNWTPTVTLASAPVAAQARGATPATVATAQPATATPVVTPTASPEPAPHDQVDVIEVLSGDSIKIRFGHGELRTVRYVGITAPSINECFGREALARNVELVNGRTVELERGNPDEDKEGSLLAYVWVTGDDNATRFVNEELLKFGFAAPASGQPLGPYSEAMKGAERAAREQNAGLWASCSGPHQPLPTPTPRPLTIGDTVRSDQWEVTVLSAQRINGPLVWSEFGNATSASGQWYIVRIKLTNVSKEGRSPDAEDYELRTADGTRFSNFSDRYAVEQWALRNGLRNFGGAVAPGISKTTALAFDINPSARGLQLVYEPAQSRPFYLD